MAASTVEPLRVGGQAVIEGVMMRAGRGAAVAVRRPDGRIEVDRLPVPGWADRHRSVPFVRGLAALAESLAVGVRALTWSEGVSGVRPADRRPMPLGVLVTMALAATVVLVVVLPATAAELVGGSAATHAAVEAGARIAILAGYVGLVARRREVRRVFEYHGAEHLVVRAHEDGLELEPAAIRHLPIHHPRCGTSFLVAVATVTALVHPLLPAEAWTARVGLRVLVVPLVAALAFEVLTVLGRLAASRPGGTVESVLLWPQRFTTRRPDDHQIEVAVAALREALVAETTIAPASARAIVPSPAVRTAG